MVCNSCGKEHLKENSNFCIHCGASRNYNIEEQSRFNTTKHNTAVINHSNEPDMSYLKWLGTLLIPFIPILGGIVFLVMVIVWAVTKNTNPSKSNWAKAYLLYALTNIVLSIILTFILIVIVAIIIEGVYY